MDPMNNESDSMTIHNDMGKNLTEPLMFNLKSLFNIDLNDQDHHHHDHHINLIFLRIILCFHHEASLLGLSTIFLLKKIILFCCFCGKFNQSSIFDKCRLESTAKIFKDSYQLTRFYRIKKVSFPFIQLFTIITNSFITQIRSYRA